MSVNGKKVGDIVPSEGNWQSIGIKGNPALSLKEGPNTISIATRAPELPQIEDVKVVSTRSIQAFSSREYKAFCDKAKKRSQYKVPQPFYINSTVPRDVKDVHIEGTEIGEVDLVYSFFSDFSFVKGEQIFITTSSETEHDFDLVYYGCEDFSIAPINAFSSDNAIPGADYVIGDVVIDTVYQPIAKPSHAGRSATSLEMQGLNWKAISEPVLKGNNPSRQVASLLLQIPKEGYYLLRVRTRHNGHTGLADVNVNGMYFYSNMPISYTMLKYSLDGQIPGVVPNWELGTYAKANNSKGDPFLFIQGSDADRVVGYSDDCSRTIQREYKLKANDSFIQQNYQVKTSAISVLKYDSQQPEGKCTVVSDIMIFPDKVSKELADYDMEGDNKPTIYGDFTLQDPIQLDYHTDSLTVTAFDFSANQLKSVLVEEDQKIYPYQLGITNPGFYFLRLESGSEVKTVKIKIIY